MSERVKRNYLDEEECVWIDSDHVLHVDAVKMCKVMGYPPTRENQDAVEAACREAAAEHHIPAKAVNDLL